MGRPGCRQYAFADLFCRDAAGEIFKLRDEDVAFGPENLGMEPSLIRRRVDEALAAVGMSRYA